MSSLPPASLTCTICSEYYKPSDEILCTSCGHVFHKACYQDWQIRSSTCPDCRSALPQTQRLYLHFEEHSQAERQLHQTKTELVSKIIDLERQLSESEANFTHALEALSAKEEQLKELTNEIEYRKAQNESYEHELNHYKLKLSASEFNKDLCKALGDLKVTETDHNYARHGVDSPHVNGSADMDTSSSSISDSTILTASDQINSSADMDSSFSERTILTTAEKKLDTSLVATKSIFASRFALNTTELEVKDYIQEKLPNLKELTVFKLPRASRRFCSFRITVSQPFYDIIVQPGFWSEFSVVRQRKITLPKKETAEGL